MIDLGWLRYVQSFGDACAVFDLHELRRPYDGRGTRLRVCNRPCEAKELAWTP